MQGLFSGLESLGFASFADMSLYNDKNENDNRGDAKTMEEGHQIIEADLLFDKTHVCPVCDKEFKAKTVKTGKSRLLSTDSDLRPKYYGIDPIKYDAIVCPNCGYAALNRYFTFMTGTQAKLIKEKITRNFTGLGPINNSFTYDEAIIRYKLALLNSVVKRSKTSERAYTCLKIAWLLRGKKESLDKNMENYQKLAAESELEEADFLLKAYDGFCESFSKEMFPISGMDENTLNYLVAELARRLGKLDESARMLSKILISKTATERIKNKARDLKDLIKEAKAGQGGI